MNDDAIPPVGARTAEATKPVLVIDDCYRLWQGSTAGHLDREHYETPCSTTGQWFRSVLFPILTECTKADDQPEAGASSSGRTPPRPMLFLINANFKYGEAARRCERHGVELLQHLRLTADLPAELRHAPVVLYSLEPVTALHAGTPANLIVYAPGSILLRLPEDLRTLLDANQWAIWTNTLPQATEAALRSYVKAGDDTDLRILYAHSYRNRVGVAKFADEFAGDSIRQHHPFLEDCAKEQLADIALKRLLFLMPHYARGARAEEKSVRSFAEECSGHRFLYIDDEHSRGWSLVLHAGISAFDLHQSEYQSLCASSRASTDDEMLQVISSYEEAERFIDEAISQVDHLRRSWTDAGEAREREGRINRECETARRLVQSLDARIRRESTVLDAIDPAGNQMPRLRAQREKLRQLRREFSDAEHSLLEHDAELQRAVRQLQAAEDQCREIVPLLCRVFPFSAVLLDLRLRPDVDEHADIDRLSGIQLLRRLKENFPHVPVVLMTASEKARVAEQAAECGAEIFWTKGVSSGHELRQALRRCVSRARDRERWARMTVIKSKPEIHCREWDVGQAAFRDVWLERDRQRRADLHALLEEAHFILGHHRNSGSRAFQRHPWNTTIHILGIVQEIRWSGVSNERWSELPPEEQRFRRLRNDITHADRLSGSEPFLLATETQASEFFELTLSQLLE